MGNDYSASILILLFLYVIKFISVKIFCAGFIIDSVSDEERAAMNNFKTRFAYILNVNVNARH